MDSYKELKVWQVGIELTTDIYKLVKQFPHEEKFSLVTQMQRSVISVPSNIAEGWGWGSTKEYIKFLYIARASLMELETQLTISFNLNYVKDLSFKEFCDKITVLAKMINKLIRSLKGKIWFFLINMIKQNP